MTQLRLSVIVCVSQPGNHLSDCLRGLAEQTLPADRFEVVIVDNRSDPNTQLVDTVGSPTLNLRHVREPRQALASGIVAGLDASSSSTIAVAGEDTIPHPDWLERITASFAELPPEIAALGGEIIPIWESPRPEWLSDRLLRPLGAGLVWSVEPRAVRLGEWLLAANAAFRRSYLEQLCRFGAYCGTLPADPLCWESAMRWLTMRSAAEAYYDPAIVVRRHIPGSRLTRAWFQRQAFWQGTIRHLVDTYVKKTEEAEASPVPFIAVPPFEEVTVPVSASGWADLFDDHSEMDFARRLEIIEMLAYLLQSQALLIEPDAHR